MKVKFLPQGVELEIEPDQSVMDLAHKNGIEIKSVCNGMPSCAECRVRVVEGMHNVLPPSAKELSLIGTGYFIDQRRLSCQLLCFGDVVIDLAEQVEKAQKQGARRPQGPVRKEETQPSHAVTGNLIEQDKQLIDETKISESTAGPISAQGGFYKGMDSSAKKSESPQQRSGKRPSRKRNRRGRRTRR